MHPYIRFGVQPTNLHRVWFFVAAAQSRLVARKKKKNANRAFSMERTNSSADIIRAGWTDGH
jgi:hypothetical protein